MSGQEDALRKVLVQLQTQTIDASRQLQSIRATMGAKERDRKLQALTLREVSQLPDDTPCYKGVGKMFVREDKKAVEGELAKSGKELENDMQTLAKKAKYYQGELETAQSSLRDILQSQRAA